MRFIDRRQQRRTLGGELGQPGPAELETGVLQALVLTVQRQVVGELVEQKARDEADIGATAFDDAHGGRRAEKFLGVEPLDQRTHVLQHHMAAGLLCQAIADVLADDFVLVGGEVRHLRVGDMNDFDRYFRFVEEQA